MSPRLSRLTYPLVQSVGIVVFDGSRVLLITHGDSAANFKGIIGLPAGKIDPGEKSVETAVRELREETGLTTRISDLQALPHKYQATIKQKDGIKIFDFHVFLCHHYLGKLQSSTETTPAWVEIHDLSGMELLPNVHEAILTARKMLQTPTA